MIQVPENIIQLNIHKITIVEVDTLNKEGDEDSLYLPILQISYIRNGEDQTDMIPFETIRTDMYEPPKFFSRPSYIFGAIRCSVDKLIDRGVIVSVNQMFRTVNNPLYTPGHFKGRIYEGRELKGLIADAGFGIITFPELWSENHREYKAHFKLHDGTLLSSKWMEEKDDLIQWIKAVTADGNAALLDIQDMSESGPWAAPRSPLDYVRVPTESYFIISCRKDKGDRKTYFAACIHDETEIGRIRVNYSSTIKGAHHFEREEEAIRFAMKYSEDLKGGSFEVEEIRERTYLARKNWMNNF